MQKPRSPGMLYDIPCVKLLKVKNKLTGHSMLADDDFILKLCILTYSISFVSNKTYFGHFVL